MRRLTDGTVLLELRDAPCVLRERRLSALSEGGVALEGRVDEELGCFGSVGGGGHRKFLYWSVSATFAFQMKFA